MNEQINIDIEYIDIDSLEDVLPPAFPVSIVAEERESAREERGEKKPNPASSIRRSMEPGRDGRQRIK